MRPSKTTDLVYIAMAAALLAICSWISTPPIGTLVPFTLQTFGVFVTVGLLGGKRGTTAILIYLALAAVGVPVLSGFKGGLAALSGPTGGYVIGFLFTAFVMDIFQLISKKATGVWLLALSMVVGLAVCYLFGTLWFSHIYVSEEGGRMGFAASATICVLPYLIPDSIKIALAVIICTNKRIRKTIAPATA